MLLKSHVTVRGGGMLSGPRLAARSPQNVTDVTSVFLLGCGSQEDSYRCL